MQKIIVSMGLGGLLALVGCGTASDAPVNHERVSARSSAFEQDGGGDHECESEGEADDCPPPKPPPTITCHTVGTRVPMGGLPVTILDLTETNVKVVRALGTFPRLAVQSSGISIALTGLAGAPLVLNGSLVSVNPPVYSSLYQTSIPLNNAGPGGGSQPFSGTLVGNTFTLSASTVATTYHTRPFLTFFYRFTCTGATIVP